MDKKTFKSRFDDDLAMIDIPFDEYRNQLLPPISSSYGHYHQAYGFNPSNPAMVSPHGVPLPGPPTIMNEWVPTLIKEKDGTTRQVVAPTERRLVNLNPPQISSSCCSCACPCQSNCVGGPTNHFHPPHPPHFHPSHSPHFHHYPSHQSHIPSHPWNLITGEPTGVNLPPLYVAPPKGPFGTYRSGAPGTRSTKHCLRDIP